jgi:polysaccharide biosynthesis protein PslG
MTRSLRLSLPAALAGAGACLALAAPAPASAAKTPLKGINVARIGTDGKALARSLTRVRREGASFVRTDLRWADFEPAASGDRPADMVAAMDSFFADARSRHLKVLLTVAGTPCWASAAPDDVRGDCSTTAQRDAAAAYPPADPQTFARFSAYLTGRYASDLAAYEVWNEPDQRNELYFAGPDKAARYAALLKAAYPAVKAVAKQVPVLGGAIVGSNGAFLQALYDEGIKGSYDALSVHYYDLVLSSLKQIHRVQVHNHDRKPLWLAETGWSSCAPQKLQDGQVCVSRRTQARNLGDLYQAVRRTSWLRALAVFSIDDTDQYDLGLYDRKGHAKPAASALRRAWKSRKRKLRAVTLKVRSSHGRVVASGGGPAGDVYTLEVSVSGTLRYRLNFRLGSTNRYSLRLPAALGRRALKVRVSSMWDGRAVTRRFG